MIVFDIKRFAVHDGPGIRTTVFFRGCPLSCAWCHNPESMCGDITTVPKMVRIGEKTFVENEVVGRDYTTAELMKELMKEIIFMEESGGGVTFSGGEPLQQHDALLEMLASCKSAGMHTAVDTSGFAPWEVVAKVSQLTDLFLFDLKLMDNELHKQYTGVSNALILENLTRLLQQGSKVRIRLPLVPGVSFTENNISQTLDFLRGWENAIDGVDLLPYHSTAAHKYTRFGIENRLLQLSSLPKSELADLKNKFENAGFNVKIGG